MGFRVCGSRAADNHIAIVIHWVGFLVVFAFGLPHLPQHLCARELDGEAKIGYHDEHGTISDKVSDRQLLGRDSSQLAVLQKFWFS